MLLFKYNVQNDESCNKSQRRSSGNPLQISVWSLCLRDNAAVGFCMHVSGFMYRACVCVREREEAVVR